MYVPYDPGQVRSHGSLLHITDLHAFSESTSGSVRFPKSDSGLCHDADYELLRLLPPHNSPTMPDPSHIFSAAEPAEIWAATRCENSSTLE
eukprot:3112937-Pyramimonas_sp.AAC.1